MDEQDLQRILDSLSTNGSFDLEHTSERVTIEQRTSPEERLIPASLAALPPLLLGSGSDLEPDELLGEGGYGRVELAWQRSLQRHVAVKRPKEGEHEEVAAQLLLQEAIITGGLEHPNIIPVHALGRDTRDKPVLVMKRVEGVSWDSLLRDPEHTVWGGFSQDYLVRNIEILLQVSNAVLFAHRNGILHCDIKPSNVMVGEFGEVYLLDWGISHKYKDNGVKSIQLAGTLAYMAPEMLGGGEYLTNKTDIYLLGATLHRVITNQPRHEGGNSKNIILYIFESKPCIYDETVPKELAFICNKATHRNQDERFKSVSEFRDALSRFLSHRSSMALTDEAEKLFSILSSSTMLDYHRSQKQTHRLFTECRFAFQQALREWPDNLAAKAGLQKTLRQQAIYEIMTKNIEAAEELVSELKIKDPVLLQKIDILKSELNQEEASKKKLIELNRQFDPSISAKERKNLLVSISSIAFFVLLLIPILRRVGVFSSVYSAAIVAQSLISVLNLTVLFLDRKSLFATKVNQSKSVGLLVGVIATSLNVCLGIISETSMSIIMFNNCMLIGCISAMLGIFIDRMYFLSASICFLLGVLCFVVPGVRSLCVMLSLIVTYSVALRTAPEPTRE